MRYDKILDVISSSAENTAYARESKNWDKFSLVGRILSNSGRDDSI